MPRISLTDLVDIVSKAGGPKATKVAQVKNRDDYLPATDFYKQFRDGVVSIHKAGGARADLSKILKGVVERVRLANYPAVIEGYKKWWGKKVISWFQPPSEIFSRDEIDVSINPELGLIINGEKHLVKLYLKSEKLSKSKADLITGLMEEVLGPKSPGAKMCVLDVRNSKLFIGSGHGAGLLPMVEAELAYIAKLWPAV
jgi:hypothetical protein